MDDSRQPCHRLFADDVDYGALRSRPRAGEGALAQPAKSSCSPMFSPIRPRNMRRSSSNVSPMSIPQVLVAAHPLRGHGYDFDVPLLAGRTRHRRHRHGLRAYRARPRRRRLRADDGTVPGYAANNPDAFASCRKTVRSAPNVPLFAGKRILTPEGKDGDANGAVIKELIAAGKLLAKGTLRHPISAFLALQGAGDLPRHAAMVRRRWTSRFEGRAATRCASAR